MFCISLWSLFGYHLYLTGSNKTTLGKCYCNVYSRCCRKASQIAPPPLPNFKHLGILYIFFRVLIKWLPFLLHFSSNGILNCNPLGSLLRFLSTLATMLNPLCCYSSLQSLRHFPFPWIKIKVFKANLVTSFFFHIFFCYFISFKLNLILHHRLSVCKFYTYK